MAQIYQPGDVVRGFFSIEDSNGNAIWNPAGAVVFRNGTFDPAVSVTIGTPWIGQNSFLFTLPTGYARTDIVDVLGTAVVSGVQKAGPVAQFRLARTTDDIYTSVNALYGTPLNATVSTAGLATSAQVGGLYGTPVNLGTTDRATLTQIQTSVNAVGGTPAINRGLLSTLQTSVNAVGGTPANLIVGGQFTAFALANAPAGGGAGNITAADAAALRTAAAIIGANNANPATRTYTFTQSDGKTVTVTLSQDGQTRTVTVV